MGETLLLPITVGVVLVGAFVLLLYSKRHVIAKMAVTLGLEGIEFSAEFREAVQKEVGRVAKQMLHRTVLLDRQLVTLWEREALATPGDAGTKLALRMQHVANLEAMLATAPDAERVSVGMTLREAYWDLLREARMYYASSDHYQQIRARVMNGFAKLEELST
jgi:hypothetical protein